MTPCPGQPAAQTALVTFTRISSGGQGDLANGLNQLCKGSFAALPFLHFFVHRVHLGGSPEHLILQPVAMVTRHQHLGAGRQLLAVAALVDGDESPQSGRESRGDRPAGSV